jgi:hypothetical protein
MLPSVKIMTDNLSGIRPLSWTTRFLSLTEHVSTERPAWYKADERDIHSYKTALVNHLTLIAVPVEAAACHNVMCTDPSHVSGINTQWRRYLWGTGARAPPQVCRKKIWGSY